MIEVVRFAIFLVFPFGWVFAYFWIVSAFAEPTRSYPRMPTRRNVFFYGWIAQAIVFYLLITYIK